MFKTNRFISNDANAGLGMDRHEFMLKNLNTISSNLIK